MCTGYYLILQFTLSDYFEQYIEYYFAESLERPCTKLSCTKLVIRCTRYGKATMLSANFLLSMAYTLDLCFFGHGIGSI